ncbi:MAG: MBOAT family protein [Lachnospiraceae bacterium]|nr:MBOAT family protein [Lachnospiraceae bacterium]
MIFSSLLFIFWFMPVFFFIYYLAPGKLKNIVLFLGSIIFYGWGEPKYLLLIFISIIINYIAGLVIDREKERILLKRGVFLLCLLFDISMLFLFKYINFFIDNINSCFHTEFSFVEVTLPLGISFYTFQIMSYVIDLYRGKVKAQYSPLKLGTYLIMFPQLIAGPIVVYGEVEKELDERKLKLEDIEEGIKIFILGLSSKVIIANSVGSLWDELDKLGYDNISTPLAWLGAIAYTLQIYFDFNGYSLMAIGLGKLLGFNFPKNFDLPYISSSITEFWRRWHMTLSGWFREYLYIPLGGNRKGKFRTYVNLFIVWFLTGLWHGASWNFVMWGLYFFILLSLEKLFLGKIISKMKLLAHIYTLFLVVISWVIFAITDPAKLLCFLKSMFIFKGGEDIIYYAGNYGLIIIIAMVASSGLLSRIFGKIKNKAVSGLICMGLLLISVAYLADAAYNPFLYFRF